jgi:hypothetical protein
MRYERHKDRQRERNIARAAPDKRYILRSYGETLKCSSCSYYFNSF